MWSDVTEHQSGYRNVLNSLHWSRFYVIERKRATDSTLNLLLIWQFVDLLRTAEAIWPEQVQKRSFLLCINVAAQSSRGGVSQGLVLGSHGIQLLTPCQLYSQPGARIESQWGRKQGCKLQTLQGYLSGHQWQRPFIGCILAHNHVHTGYRGMTLLLCFHVFVVRKKEAFALCTFLIVGHLILLKPFWTHLKPLPSTWHRGWE